MAHLARAIELKDDEHQFYYLLGLVYQQRYDYDEAARSYSKARDMTQDPRLVAGYSRKLAELEVRSN